MFRYCVILLIGLLVTSGCMREQPNIIIITATFPAEPYVVAIPTNTPQASATPFVPVAQSLSPVPDVPLSQPTPNVTRVPIQVADEHTVQAGDTLSAIANRYNVSVNTLIELNQIDNPNVLSVGQVLQLPEAPSEYTPDFKIIPDSRLVRGPDSTSFDIAAFINQQPGYIRTATDTVTTGLANGAGFDRVLTSSQIVRRVALEYSVDPRLLLAMLEYRAGWLSNPQPRDDLQTHPLISAEASGLTDRSGLYRQLVWLANELNRGYYGWKYRGNVVIQFSDGSRSLYNPTLNPATIAVQYALSRAGTPYSTWEQQVSIAGLYGVYVQYFGDPFADATDPLVPPTIQQPVLDLPFEDGVEWRFTGGSHGGWGSGSAWSSVDFAPSEERPQSTFCYVSSAWVTAVARGVIARVEDGVIVLDLDGDGDEATGWTVNYLHVTVDESIRAGMTVLPGQRLGNPSCEGGVSNATHLHIGRRFNGEWLPADCQQCLTNVNIPPFVMGGWEVIGIAGQEYQGYMQKGGERIQAEQGIATDINRISG